MTFLADTIDAPKNMREFRTPMRADDTIVFQNRFVSLVFEHN
jgi:hypothetical protein